MEWMMESGNHSAYCTQSWRLTDGSWKSTVWRQYPLHKNSTNLEINASDLKTIQNIYLKPPSVSPRTVENWHYFCPREKWDKGAYDGHWQCSVSSRQFSKAKTKSEIDDYWRHTGKFLSISPHVCWPWKSKRMNWKETLEQLREVSLMAVVNR